MLRIDTLINELFILSRLILLLFLFHSLAGCNNTSETLEESQLIEPYLENCLDPLQMDNLENKLEDCNALLKINGKDPTLLNNRSIIYLLMGKNNLACNDVSQALAIIKNQKIKSNSLIINELRIRHNNCKHLLNIKAID